jgi:hypothetical protein
MGTVKCIGIKILIIKGNGDKGFNQAKVKFGKMELWLPKVLFNKVN